MGAANFGFVNPDWGAIGPSLRRLHSQALQISAAMAPYTGGLRNRGDALHDAIHDFAFRLGAPEGFLRGCVHDELEDSA